MIFPKKQLSADEFAAQILAGNRYVLSQAITLIESTRADHQTLAGKVIEKCLPHSGNSIRIGITGTPGVGKSSFVESFGNQVIKDGKKIAVLAIDPSSPINRGSILGDKTRMARLTMQPNAYIRPTAASGSLGGVARKTRETIVLCEAAGFDVILIETVGVGQSETAVASMTDFFLLLLQPGAGDELQGIKRGIVEMADLIAVNKADGDHAELAKQAQRAYSNALHLFPPKENKWIPQAVCCSALSGFGIADIWALILDYQQFTKKNNYFQTRRQSQAKYWLHESLKSAIVDVFFKNTTLQSRLSEVENEVLEGKMSSFRAAEILTQLFVLQNK